LDNHRRSLHLSPLEGVVGERFKNIAQDVAKRLSARQAYDEDMEMIPSILTREPTSPSQQLRVQTGMGQELVLGQESQVTERETERQSWFQNSCSNILNVPNCYSHVAVLIIRWHEDIDEFQGHSEEVSIPLRLSMDFLMNN
jgi:hypothetical protein